MRARAAFLALLLAVAAAASADDHPNTARGFAADKVFQVGDIDNVNLFNGNLTLTIPIGGTYSVNGGFSYGLKLVYNTNVWDFQDRDDVITGVTYHQGIPQRTQNAGLGWLLTLGRLMAPGMDGNEDDQHWMYQGNDGAEHVFYPTLHVGDPDEPGDTSLLQAVSYTRDGSYLRMKLAGGLREIEFPDGQVHHFDSQLRVDQMRDRFNNALAIAYGSQLWTLTDTQGRVQRVYFHNETQDGAPHAMVDHVELTSFAGTVTYNFQYASRSIARACPHNDLSIGASVTVPLLTSVSQTVDGASYVMPVSDYITNLTTSSPVCGSQGSLQGIRLPTWGRLQWTYRDYTFPAVGKVHRRTAAGVATRKMVAANGSVLGTWNYDTSLTGTLGSQELKNTVTDPLNHRTERYFLALPGSYAYSLPFTHVSADPNGGGRYLSTKTFDAAGLLKRTTYVSYEGDQLPTAYQSPQELMNVNRRELSSRTVFDDDAAKYASVTRSDFDGMGHYRLEATGGNFNAGDVRSTTVAFNPTRHTYHIDPTTNLPAPDHDFTMWPVGSNWVLGTYTSRTVAEGATEVSQYCFDASTGFLNRQRTLKGSGENGHDVLVVYTSELNGSGAATGNVASEKYYGADSPGQSLTSNGTTCTMGLPGAPVYEIDHTYQFGVRAKSQYAGTTFYMVDQTIHQNSGLPSSSRDTAGVETQYEYDGLGRLTWIKPQGSNADGYTEYVYSPATSSTLLANVLVNRRGAGQTATVLAKSQIFFDAFGRVWREKELLPPVSNPEKWNVRETLYDGAGNRSSVSERQLDSGGSPTRKTQFLGYDPFGRPGTIRPADGSTHDVIFNYYGTRVVERKVYVRTAHTGNETQVTITETYDRQGRLWKVTEPSGAGGALVQTVYSYDAGNLLKQAQTAVAGTTQTRVFNYDGRGFLGSETHPEKGPAGVTYPSYDPRGHALQKVDGPNGLTFQYDAAERLTLVKETSSGTDLKTFVYASANSGSNLSKGKLETTKRTNFPFYPTLLPKATIVETYTFAGRQGRVSKKTTQLVMNSGGGDTNNESFEQSYVYNLLGDVAHIDYPVCTYLASCPAGSMTPRAIDLTYANGSLTSISGFVDSITYHPNGLYNQITHANGVVDTQTNDPDSMPRPAALSAQHLGLGSSLWGTGSYGYDGAGNVATMGGSYFLYDGVSRVVDGHVYDGPTGGGAQHWQTYSYDAFGNIQSIASDQADFARSTPVDSATNRLNGTNALYDTAGNLQQAPSPSGTCASGNPCYEYDQFNMMRRMRNGGEDWRYMYTAADERLWSYRIAPAQDSSLWALRDLDGKVLREFDLYKQTKPAREYVYRNGQLVASVYPDEGTRHFSLDHLGTPRLVTSSGGYNRGIWTGATGNCKPAPADFDHDGEMDLSLLCGNTWHFYNDDGSYIKGLWTGTNDSVIPVTADYDGDGDDDMAAFDGGAWHFWDYATGAYHGIWTGTAAGCIPAPADYDGDGRADLSLKCGPVWYFYNDTTGALIKSLWTGAADSQLPVPGDYDGDGRADPAISNGAAWDIFDYVSGQHTGGIWTGLYGTPVPMDYDGDGTTDPVVFSGGGAWFAFRHDGTAEQSLWAPGSQPLHGNFGGDATEEPAIYSGGAWSVYAFAGMPIARHHYFPFGEELSSIRQDSEQMKFTGHERDLVNPSSAADDLDYMHARFYDPQRGRFLSVDPLFGDPKNPQSLNRYSYVLDSPMTKTDPTGLYEEDVHEDLTAVLAEAVGFSANQATAIARADQGVDDDSETGPFAGEDARRDYHFTSGARRDQMWQTFMRSGSLGDLGQYMHAEQDSFSHEGYGPRVGHLFHGHAPDKTYNDVAKANRMAADTYNRLSGAANRLGVSRANRVAWDKISRLVDAFNRASSRDEKAKLIGALRSAIRGARRP